MSFLNDYAISIIVASVLAILLENLLPEGDSKKYMSIIIGLFVMLVILNPMTKLPHYQASFAIPELRLNDDTLSVSTHPYIADIFEKNLALTICEDIKSTFGTNASCRVSCLLNDDGQITGIRQINLSPHTKESVNYIAQKYGIEEVLILP